MTDKELLNKYNTLVAKCKDLQEQIKTNKQEYEKESVINNTNIKLIREFCETILAKDRREMKLDDSYTWNKIGIRELISKAEDSYKEYNKNRTKKMAELGDMLEERGQEIDSLTEEILYMKNHGYAEKIEEVEDKTDEIQKNVKVSEAEDVDMGYLFGAEGMEVPTDKSIPTKYPNNKIAQALQKSKDNKTRKEYTRVEINETIDHLSDLQKNIIICIGRDGKSKSTDINEIIEKEEGKTLDKNFVGISYQELVKLNILKRETLSIATQSKNTNIYNLLELGKRIYNKLTGKEPVKSESEYIIEEHDNIQHGYTIKDICTCMENSNLYKYVNMHCRKRPFKCKDNASYIPDILVEKGNKKYFIEVELAKCTESDYFVKFNKMSQHTEQLYVIVPSQKAANRMLNCAKHWKQNAKENNNSFLMKRSIYIITFKEFQDKNFDLDSEWNLCIPAGSCELKTR